MNFPYLQRKQSLSQKIAASDNIKIWTMFMILVFIDGHL